MAAGAGEKLIVLPDKSTARAIYGHVTVPLRRDIETDSTLTIPYIRVLAKPASRKPPVFVLEYGPSHPGTEALDEDQLGTLLNDLLTARDVVFFDQRGTSDESDRFDCFHTYDHSWIPAPTRPERQVAADRLASDCASLLRERGIDITAYNINESADDIANLASHLGLEEIALFGTSHGSGLALNVIRRHSGLVERALIAAVADHKKGFSLPHKVDDVLSKLDDIAAHPGSNWPFDDPPSHAVDKALSAFDVPRRMTYTDIYDRKIEIDVSRYDATRFLFKRMGTKASWQRLPARIAKFSNAEGLEELARAAKDWRRFVGFFVLTITSRCLTWVNEDVLSKIEQQVTTSVAGDLFVFPFPEVCKAWETKPLPSDLRMPFESNVPVLMISGDIDHKTPIAYADELAKSLDNAVHIKIANMGHQLLIAYEDLSAVRNAVLDFMDGKPVDSAQHVLPFEFVNVE